MQSDKETYLAVPFDEKEDAKKAAGKLSNGEFALQYDKEQKLWKAKPGADLSKLEKWLPKENSNPAYLSEKDPVAEFADELDAAGFVLNGAPAMDGKKHRVATIDDKKGSKSGIYVGYLDGRPAGWYQDHRNHDKPVKWVATGKAADHEKAVANRAIAAQNKAKRETEQKKSYDHHAQRVGQLYSLLPDSPDSHPYLTKKNVPATQGLKVDKKGRLVVPLYDQEENIRSLQRIDQRGNKRLKKGAQKSGSFFVVGKPLENGKPVLYAEGFSTAASIHAATGHTVVMTVDAGNLPKVAESLSKRYPDSSQIIFGDNDQWGKVNKGLEKAEEAARLAKGRAVFPDFSGVKDVKGLTDFNDLHNSLGIETVKQQVEYAMSKAEVKKPVEIDMKVPEGTPEAIAVTEKNLDLAYPDREQESQALEDAYNDYMTYMATEDVEVVNTAQDLSQQNDFRESVITQTEEKEVQPIEVDNSIEAVKVQEQVAQHQQAPEVIATVEQEQNVEPVHPEQNTSEQLLENSIEAVKVKEFEGSTAEQEQVDSSIDEEEEKRFLARIKGMLNRPVPEANQNLHTGQVAEAEDAVNQNVANQESNTLPDHIKKKFIQVDNNFYFGNRPDSLAFQDHGKKLKTKLSSKAVASSMVDIAESRNWTELKAKGTEEFKREIWLEASLREIAVQGFKPKEADFAVLKKRAQERAGHRENIGQGADKSNPVDKLSGKLVDHGAAPYQNKPNAQSSYFVKIQNTDGKERTTWGVDLERAMSNNDIEKGDNVTLNNLGKKAVTVQKEITNGKGEVTGTKDVRSHRNQWEVKAQHIRDSKPEDIIEKDSDLLNEVIALKLAEKFSKKFSEKADQEKFLGQVRERLAANVEKGSRVPDIKIKEERDIEKKEPELER